ncbi:AfsR/SARP family transcriptional regulator [Luteipulveratus halotolerans]|uniref:AfsR/SARP family transcriptional regulator n=1 Tax=Luteipulveratus halotolerans TaxID=1631356 RepID=UPI0006821B62|nr:BTAD domain-containing putative transcriptional regulator [Luteipulveratus halotolerans]
MTDGSDLLKIRMLGAFEVDLGGRRLTLGRRLATLLAVIASDAGPVSRAQLVDRVWGESPPADAKQFVQSAIHRLRSATHPDVIVTAGEGYALDEGRVEVDVRRFVALVRGRGRDRARELREALDLWRGEPFAGTASPWLADVEAARLHELHLAAALEHADLALDSGRVGPDLVSQLSGLTRSYPLHEPVWERLLQVLRAAGRVPEALGRYDEVRRRLRDELGVDPGPELRSAYDLLLAGDGEPERSVRRTPRQLPSPAARFTGRAAEMSELTEVLTRTSGPRIAVVAGVGGAGKTSLVLQWAHSVREQFPDGQLFVDLRGYSDERPVSAADTLSRLLRSLGVPPGQVPLSVDERSALLRECTTDLDLLIVLDNACDAAQIRHLLPGPGAMTVVTSRNQMRGLMARQGADRISVGGMPEDDALGLLHAAVGERVSAEPAAARDLVQVCGALPLALSVAAERATRFPDVRLTVMAREMSDRLGALDAMSEPSDDFTDIRTVFDYSYRSLHDDEKRVFRFIGLAFGPTTTLHAAAMADLSERESRRVLDRLVAASLLDQPTPGTYLVHDLLRAYARERCAEEETPEEVVAVVRRTLAWGQRSFQAAVDLVRPAQIALDLPVSAHQGYEPADFADAVRWFEEFRPTILQWLEVGARHGLYADVWRLCVQTSVLLEVTERRDDATEVAQRALAAVQHLDDERALYVTEYLVAQSLQRVDDLVGSLEWLDRGHKRAQMHGDRDAEAIIVTVHGTVLRRMGEHDDGMALQDQATDLLDRRTTADGPLRASRSAVLINRGGAAYEQYRFDAAIRDTERALEVARAERDPWREALALNNLSVMSLVVDDAAAAEQYARQAVVLSERLAAPGMALDARATQGRLLRDAGDRDGARRVWEQALELLPGQTNPRRLEIVELLEETRTSP